MLWLVLAFGAAKIFLDVACNFEVALRLVLSQEQEQVMKTLCQEAEAGAGGDDYAGGIGNECINKAGNMPIEYKPFVKSAADKYLNGDQAKIIAIVLRESNWNQYATSPTGPAGIGQFAAKTAIGLDSFPNKNSIKTIPENMRGEKNINALLQSEYKNDDRFNPEYAIMAIAEYISEGLSDYNQDFRMAYAKHYNREPNGKDIINADIVWKNYNNLLNNNSCNPPEPPIPGKNILAGTYVTIDSLRLPKLFKPSPPRRDSPEVDANCAAAAKVVYEIIDQGDDNEINKSILITGAHDPDGSSHVSQAHKRGFGLDIAGGSLTKSNAPGITSSLLASGWTIKVIDEYNHATKMKTGNHIHAELACQPPETENNTTT